MGGQNKNFRAMLAQQQVSYDHKLEEKKQRELQLKAERKKEAHDLQVQHGMVDETQLKARDSDSRRQHKLFLDSLFVPPINSIIYNDKRLFRTKEAMQLYFQRPVDPVEWKDNLDVLLSLKEKHLVATPSEDVI